MKWTELPVTAFVWSSATILLYFPNRQLHRLVPKWWTSPLMLTPILLVWLAVELHIGYSKYIRATHWLVSLLGAVTVAFAVPIYEQRKLISESWKILIIGLLVGSATSVISSWTLATVLGLNDSVRLSLLPRSISTPFAMSVSSSIGGMPDLTAVFVALTGVFGAALGEAIIYWLPLRSALARGALLGMGAHGAGVAKAHRIGQEEGAIAGLVMVFVGVTNVLVAPLAVGLLKRVGF